MASKLWLVALVLALVVAAESSTLDESQWGISRVSSGDGNLPSMRSCNGRVGDCINDEDEEMMGSESDRRQLQGRGRRRFISYAVLKKDQIPCSHRGNSYYNCQAGNRINPYNRGCTFITRCARYLG